MVEVAFEAALKDKQDTNQMPKGTEGRQRLEKRIHKSSGAQRVVLGPAAAPGNRGDSKIIQSHLDLPNGNSGSGEQSMHFEQVHQVTVRHLT